MARSGNNTLLIDVVNKFVQWKKVDCEQQTAQEQYRMLRQFCIYTRNCSVESVTIDDVVSWFTLMKETKFKQNTLILRASALRNFFDYCRKIGLNVINPELIPIPKREYNKPKVINETSYLKLLAALPKKNLPHVVRNRAMIMMLWDTGMRVGELVALNESDVDKDKRSAKMRTEKSRGRRPFREVFWSEAAHKQLEKWLRVRKGLNRRWGIKNPLPIFQSCNTYKVGQRIDIGGVAVMLRRLSKKAKIPTVNAHSFRHHKGRHIIESGGSAADVMNILGHASLNSSTVYTALWGKELRERAEKFL